MKILHIVTDLIRGGSEGQCARTAMGLKRMGVDSAVAVFYRQGFFLKEVEQTCGPVYEIPIRKAASLQTIRSIRSLAAFIRAQKFDLVHTWDAEATVFGFPAVEMADTPLITSRRDLGQIYPRWKEWMLDQADKKAVAVVANANAIAEHFSTLGLAREKINVIGNILDLNEFDELARNQKSEAESQTSDLRSPTSVSASLNIACIARLDAEKDHQTLLRAFALVLPADGPMLGRVNSPDEPPTSGAGHRKPQTFLHIVGDGAQRPFLQKLAEELGISDQVIFHGERSDIPALLQEMDLGLLTPKSNEGLSNTILEYMASSLPVIATDCGGNRELIEGGTCGWVIPKEEPRACADAMQHFIDDPAHARELGRNGRTFVEQHHLPDIIIQTFKELYESLL